MRIRGFDWRWAAGLAVLVVLAGAQRLPPLVVAAALAAAGGYLLRYGWRIWAGGRGPRGGRVVYWRGQRIEVDPGRGPRLPALREIGPAAIYLALGALLALAAISVGLRALGL